MTKPFYYLILTCFFITLNAHAEAPNPVTSKNNDWQYTVIKNDSFERIYKTYLNKRANIEALSEYNHHKLTKKLQPQQVLSIPLDMLRRTPTSAKVLIVAGDVTFSTATDPSKKKLSLKDSLSTGDSIQTGKNSLAKIEFADGSVTDIQPNSMLLIQNSFVYVGKNTHVIQLKLSAGRTEIAANPTHTIGNSMQVETPSAIAAVRGTQFRVGAEGEVALQETLDGQVAFSAGGQAVLLDKGFGSAVEKEKAPLPPIVLPNAPNLGEFPKVIDSIPVEFHIPAQPDAVGWVAQLALDDKFTKILDEQEMSSIASVGADLSYGDLADGDYYLRMRAKEEHGLQGLDAFHSFSVKARPLPPVLVEPVDAAALSQAPIELSWTVVPGANNYIVQIAKDADFKDIVFVRIASSNKLSVVQSFGSGEFYWRVAMLLKKQPQKFSKVRKFSR